MSSFAKRLALFTDPSHGSALRKISRGIEKESLRVTPAGRLAHTPHPAALGSTLTHPQITTDYSEALLEFITPPSQSVDEVEQTLMAIHNYSYRHIGDELLWAHSMPCSLQGDSDIPEAKYGSSNIGQMKQIYRIGLGHRYGRLMQAIAGIHYNFSLPDSAWQILQSAQGNSGSLQDFKTHGYFGLIRNFRRYYWLLLYLFGASPAVCRSFVKNRDHQLTAINGDEHSLHAPLATSLRMGDLGYQSDAQSSLVVCYNRLENYINTLREALTQPYPAYEQAGLKAADGSYQQLNTHLLQIENEFYSAIRPKRTTASGETPVAALWERGVEYIEVRCLDVNPYLPVGIDTTQMRFMDTFLLYCLLQESPDSHIGEYNNILENQRRLVYRGRDPELTLLTDEGERPMLPWAQELFTGMAEVAKLLDDAHGDQLHSQALAHFQARLDHPEQIPASQLLAEIRDSGDSYFQTALKHARQHREFFLDSALDPALAEQFEAAAALSLEKQQQIEAAPQVPFDQFLADFYKGYDFSVS